jgi:hypothetical protein
LMLLGLHFQHKATSLCHLLGQCIACIGSIVITGPRLASDASQGPV